MAVVKLAEGLELNVDDSKYTVQGGLTVGFSEQMSSDLLITLDMNIRDILENTESKAVGVATVRKHG